MILYSGTTKNIDIALSVTLHQTSGITVLCERLAFLLFIYDAVSSFYIFDSEALSSCLS